MTLQESIDLLRGYNEWRRYDGPIGQGPAMPEPKEIGIAIDTVVSALDNGLHTGDYPVADGYTCYITRRTIHVKKKVRRCRETGDYRCIDCQHRKMGQCFVHRRYVTWVCSKKPKGEGLFYCAPASRKVCEMFELKEGK